MKLYEKTFVNPLLAMAFKDGIEFIADPDYKVMEPKQEGPNKWVVLIEHEDDDDDYDEIVPTVPTVAEPKRQVTLRDYEERLKQMTPIEAKSSNEIIHPPIKISGEELQLLNDVLWPCGECIPCLNGGDCIKAIEIALQRQHCE